MLHFQNYLIFIKLSTTVSIHFLVLYVDHFAYVNAQFWLLLYLIIYHEKLGKNYILKIFIETNWITSYTLIFFLHVR